MARRGPSRLPVVAQPQWQFADRRGPMPAHSGRHASRRICAPLRRLPGERALAANGPVLVIVGLRELSELSKRVLLGLLGNVPKPQSRPWSIVAATTRLLAALLLEGVSARKLADGDRTEAEASPQPYGLRVSGGQLQRQLISGARDRPATRVAPLVLVVVLLVGRQLRHGADPALAAHDPRAVTPGIRVRHRRRRWRIAAARPRSNESPHPRGIGALGRRRHDDRRWRWRRCARRLVSSAGDRGRRGGRRSLARAARRHRHRHRRCLAGRGTHRTASGTST
mmetsp:Transcript_125905/g.352528  ORF Transcript_125905/g.352528 Transcript_125905/m.352528 type:complete len:282 (+) Transcript_125905:90-935(+)